MKSLNNLAESLLNKEVLVLDVSNYKSEYSKDEDMPMKAILYEISDGPCFWVRSIKTNKEYELYRQQIEEFSSDELVWHIEPIE